MDTPNPGGGDAVADPATDDIRHVWERYAACWSAPSTRRQAEVDQAVTGDVRYRDAAGQIVGSGELSTYMSGFAETFPGHRFRIDVVTGHHDRSLATWTQLDGNGHAVTQGISVAQHGQRRLRDITGFFLDPA